MDSQPMLRKETTIQGFSYKWTRFAWGALNLTFVLAQVGLLSLVVYIHQKDIQVQKMEIQGLRWELNALKEGALEEDFPQRDRREIKSQIEEDVVTPPTIVEAKYSEARKNGTYKARGKTEGLRIYRSWFKKGRKSKNRGGTPPGSKASPIKKHHSGANSRSNSARRDSRRSKERTLRRANKQSETLSGMKAVHFEARGSSSGGGGSGSSKVLNKDGLFRDWRLSRWSARLRSGESFPMRNGTLKVSAPGLYYVYAQINYLDERSVNAFQILKNREPLFLCTTMTGGPPRVDKANTCFTAGVVYMEQGDSLSVKDLEPRRNFVSLPSHSFFGLIQISSIGI